MPRISQALLLFAALIHLLPISGAISAAQLERLYGVAIADPNLEILMRHRAMLFAPVAVLLVAAAFRVALRPLAIALALLSMLSFVAIAVLVGDPNPALTRVMGVDLFASLGLVGVALSEWKRARADTPA